MIGTFLAAVPGEALVIVWTIALALSRATLLAVYGSLRDTRWQPLNYVMGLSLVAFAAVAGSRVAELLS